VQLLPPHELGVVLFLSFLIHIQVPEHVPAAFWLKICCCWVKTTPAPTPPTKSTSPKIVAIIFPPPNFFFGVAITGGKSEGAAEPDELSAGGVVEVGDGGTFM
jgi:hypothetical protein